MKFVGIIWSKWKIFAHKIGVFQSKVILTVFYFTLLLPFGIIFSIFKDALGIKTIRNSTWTKKTKQRTSIKSMQEQY